MPPRDSHGQVGEIRAISTCIIATRILLEATDEPNSGSTMPDAPKPRAFSASELVQCGACSRTNPPTRASCLYCGAALEVTELNAFAPEPVPDTGSSSAVSFHVVALDA